MSEKIYGWLLRFYPRAFREEYGAASRQLFRDRWRAERGLFGKCRLWWDVLGDLTVSIPREYRRPADPAHSQTAGYRLSEQAVEQMMAKGRGPFPLYLVLPVFFAIGWLGGAPRLPLLAGHALLAVPLIAGHRQHRARGKRQLLSLELLLEPDRIERRQPGFDLTMLRTEVARVDETESGLVVSAQDQRIIWVPNRLNGYQEVREHLAAWMPIGQPGSHHALRFKQRHAVSVLFPAYVSALLVRSPYWYLPLALLAGMGLAVMAHAAGRRRPGVPVKPAPVIIMLALLAALIVKGMLLLR